jgi:hypothetical protein
MARHEAASLRQTLAHIDKKTARQALDQSTGR